ncbi:MAG: nitrilase [Proteobacteria bacterium]|nr:nitrilase [Pseudomonadota bacterium]
MKVCVHQTAPRLLDLQANLEEVIAAISHSRERGAELIVFPELALTGYFVGAKYHEVALRLDSAEIKRLAAATKGTAAVVGFIEESLSMNFYNSALVAVDGRVLFADRKLNLPNYGVFEERKYFASGRRVQLFRYLGFNIAVFICSDLWHPSLPYLGVTQKADVFLSLINSSETAMGEAFDNIETWGIINSFYSRVFGIYVVCANRVGEETIVERRSIAPNPAGDESGDAAPKRRKTEVTYRFWGGSEIVNPYGQRIAQAGLNCEEALVAELSRDLLRQKKILLPYLRNDDPYFTHRELQRILYEERWRGGPREP